MGHGRAPSPSPPFAETPEKTVQAFVDAFNAHDSAAMARQVVGQKDGRLPFLADFPTLTAKLGETKVDGDSATIPVDVDLSPQATRWPKHVRETVSLRRIDGDWRIVPADPEAHPNTPEETTLVAGLARVVSNPELMNQARKGSKQTASLMNVKKIALATILYANDHKDRLPSSAKFKAALMPYLRNADVFTAPDAPKGTMSYFLDPRLSGKPLASISRLAETAMILQGAANRTAFPYDERTPLGYADGHVKIVDAPKVIAARKVALQ